MDENGIVADWNSQAEKLFGWSRSEALGKPLADLIIPEMHQSAHRAGLERFLRTGEGAILGHRLEIEARRRDQREIKVELSITALKRRDGVVFNGFVRDLTDRIAAEERLRQAEKMEAVGQLTGGIAHDFNNLLQGVTGSLDLIRRKADDPERVQQWAEAGLLAADRGAKLTAQLLAFSRAQKLELKPLNLALLLSNMRELLERTLGPGVRVCVTPDDNLPAVLGDETQLELAVINLAINARDAMPEGGDLIIVARRRTIAGDSELPRGDYVELSVTDTGCGMPTDVAARAFDPFFTTKGVGKGTGLGLSQVYGMARQAGGSARLRSVPGEGTTASLFLRFAAGSAAKSVVHDVAEKMPRPSPAHILVVDDDPDVRRVLEGSLRGLGYTVVLAENGIAGLEMLSRAKPDLMIVDYAMPGMTGAELSKHARAMNASLPIIFASGYSETSALERAADEKTFVLRKPFRLSELQRALSRALQR
jgi:PAS domain S-box-containing protein